MTHLKIILKRHLIPLKVGEVFCPNTFDIAIHFWVTFKLNNQMKMYFLYTCYSTYGKQFSHTCFICFICFFFSFILLLIDVPVNPTPFLQSTASLNTCLQVSTLHFFLLVVCFMDAHHNMKGKIWRCFYICSHMNCSLLQSLGCTLVLLSLWTSVQTNLRRLMKSCLFLSYIYGLYALIRTGQ